MELNVKLAGEYHVKVWQIDALIKLLDEGNTIPFIARYRKEQHGEMDDQTIRSVAERLESLRALDERKQEVLTLLDKQGVLNDTLDKQVKEAETLSRLEDLYRPYRPKRKTRASVAKEKGLEPLADKILLYQMMDISTLTKGFYGGKNQVETEEQAIKGAMDIIAERISDSAAVRAKLKDLYFREAVIKTEKDGEDPEQTYKMYYDYSETIRTLPSHRILAINRGEKEKKLKVNLEVDESKVLRNIYNEYLLSNYKSAGECVKTAADDAYSRLIAPSLYTEIRNEQTEKAQNEAIHVFADNLKHLLMQPPIKGKVALGLDPGIRTGCKVAVVDENGSVLDTDVIYPLPMHGRVQQAKEKIKGLIIKHNISVVGIGNGTAGRETEAFFVELMQELDPSIDIGYIIVNEAGASVYSASKLAAEEFPQYDVSLRSAVSLARRLQDPLAELVKIDPKAIGIGQYQHDLKEKKLDEALDDVVEDCVNSVGVDLNTASYTLLSHIAGINDTIAKNIVTYREDNGAFKLRSELKKVPKLGPKTFEQCAGFLRIPGGKKPIENTGVHPESYTVAEKLLELLNLTPAQAAMGQLQAAVESIELSDIATKINAGEPTVRDIIKELSKPGRDPRDELPQPFLRKDVMTVDDLTPGMQLKGTVRNVTDFGAFIDIGVHRDGLVHISKMAKKRIRHPSEIVHVGDIVDVWVLDIEDKKRISLTLIKPEGISQ